VEVPTTKGWVTVGVNKYSWGVGFHVSFYYHPCPVFSVFFGPLWIAVESPEKLRG